jgi:ankyrin repeat protein
MMECNSLFFSSCELGALSVAAVLTVSALGLFYSSKSVVVSAYHKYDSSACRLLSQEHLEPIALRQWKAVLSWVAFHPEQVASFQDAKNQTVLHHACLFRAPAHVLESILCAAPELASIANRDGELALHWAIRLSTPIPVLKLLLNANPETAFWRDHLNMTALSLLWERHYSSSMLRLWRDDPSQLLETNSWNRIVLVFRAVHEANKSSSAGQREEGGEDDFLVLHTAASRPCPPGMFPLLIHVYASQLNTEDTQGRLPLTMACQSPSANRSCDVLTKVQMLLREDRNTARHLDHSGRYPLHVAVASGVQWDEGVESLLSSHPFVISACDPITLLYPYQLAATVMSSHFSEPEDDLPLDRVSSSAGGQLLDHDLTIIYRLLRFDPSLVDP